MHSNLITRSQDNYFKSSILYKLGLGSLWSLKRKIQARKSNLQLSVRFTRMIGFDTTVYHTKEDKKNYIIGTR